MAVAETNNESYLFSMYVCMYICVLGTQLGTQVGQSSVYAKSSSQDTAPRESQLQVKRPHVLVQLDGSQTCRSIQQKSQRC